MTDTTAAPSAPPSYGGLQNAHQLPSSDGGGVVFPFGFFGPVYYLPEWEFIRYATAVQQLNGDIRGLSWWRRLFRSPSGRQRWGVLIATFVGTIVAMRTGLVTPQLLWSLVLGGTAWSFYVYAFQIYVNHGPRFQPHFPSARRLPLHAYWSAHTLTALLAMTRKDYLRILGRFAIRGLIGYYAYKTLVAGTVHPLFPLLAMPALLLQISQHLFLLLSLVAVRLSLGRRPSPADLHPVDPPP